MERLPDFSKLASAASGVVDSFSLKPAEDHDFNAFALLFDGYIDIPRDGMYAFTTSSNDGSRLYIGNRRVINNDGLHKEQAVTGFIGLRKGKHPIRVSYFEAGGVDALKVSYTGPDIPYQEIPPEALLHNVK